MDTLPLGATKPPEGNAEEMDMTDRSVRKWPELWSLADVALEAHARGVDAADALDALIAQAENFNTNE